MGDLLGKFDLVRFGLGQTLFVSRDQGRILGLQGSVDQLADFRFRRAKLDGEGLLALRRPRFLFAPELAQALIDDAEQERGRLHGLDQIGELALDLGARNGAGIGFAGFLATMIIGVAPVAALGPIGGKLGAAARADHIAAKRKIRRIVFPHDALGYAVQAALDFLKGLERDQRRVMAGTQRHVPMWDVDVAGEEGIAQNDPRRFVGDATVRLAGELRMAGEEACDIGLRRQMPAREAFESLLNDRRQRLVALDDRALSFALIFAVAKPSRQLQAPMPGQAPSAHSRRGLRRVLAAMLARKGGFNDF